MRSIDDYIIEFIKEEFKSVKEISEGLQLPYVRVAVRIKQLRKAHRVIAILSNKPEGKRGVRPLKYKIKTHI